MKRFNFCCALIALLIMCGCEGKNVADKKSEKRVDDMEFYATQPLQSGLYDADSYDITGVNGKKGKYDGRIYFSLSPELSAFYVFENGNRTKISYAMSMDRPFERNDSGFYTSVDIKGNPVVMTTDSSAYTLHFKKGESDITIGFNPKPRYRASALEILEKMNETMQKAK